jgi:hypothetical protein
LIDEKHTRRAKLFDGIGVDYPQTKIDYILPMPQKIKARTPTEEVLALEQSGVRNWTETRTFFLTVEMPF